MGMSCISRVIAGILSFLRLGLSLAIIIIVAEQLYHINIYIGPSGNAVFYQAHCLIDGRVSGQNVCDYAYAVCGLSLLLSLLTSILLCVTCDMCGAGVWLEFVVEGFQTAWWVVAGIVMSDRVKTTNDVVLENGYRVPKQNWRTSIAVITWVAALLSFLVALVYLTEALKALAKCCGCCGYKKDDGEHKHKKDKEDARKADYYAEPPPPPQPQPGAAPAYPPATRDDRPVQANAV